MVKFVNHIPGEYLDLIICYQDINNNDVYLYEKDIKSISNSYKNILLYYSSGIFVKTYKEAIDIQERGVISTTESVRVLMLN